MMRLFKQGNLPLHLLHLRRFLLFIECSTQYSQFLTKTLDSSNTTYFDSSTTRFITTQYVFLGIEYPRKIHSCVLESEFCQFPFCLKYFKITYAWFLHTKLIKGLLFYSVISIQFATWQAMPIGFDGSITNNKFDSSIKTTIDLIALSQHIHPDNYAMCCTYKGC